MDISLAVIQPKLYTEKGLPKGLQDYNPADYEILITDTTLNRTPGNHDFVPDPAADPLRHRRGININRPVSATGSDKGARNHHHLPRCQMSFDQEPAEVALGFVRKLSRPGGHLRCRRAVRVALWQSEPSTPSHSTVGARCSSALFCIPVAEKDKHQVFHSRKQRLGFMPMDQLLSMCHNSSGIVDAETRHLVIRLDQWLRERQRSQRQFLATLFVRSSASSRLRFCAHNPAHSVENRSIVRKLHSSQLKSNPCTDLGEEARKANEAATVLMALDKCDVFIMNALFGCALPYKVGKGQQMVEYFAKDRPAFPQPSSRSAFSHKTLSNSGSSAESGSWGDEFPLHRLAYLGETEQIKEILRQGADPNLPDKDSWTPIHYAAWYGRLGAMQALLSYGSCAVNARNKKGSTPMHFAAWSGHQYVIELLLSHPDVDLTLKDHDGKKPIDLCECVPKPEWQAAAKLLKAAQAQKLPKIKVDLMDGSNVMLSLMQGLETTTAELHAQMKTELGLTDTCARLFAIWIGSESLELQLKADHKPALHLQRWKSKILTKWSDSPDPSSEEPILMFRRDVRVSVSDERQTKLTDQALALLYHEAHHNYIRGLYPCEERDMVMVAALMLQIVHKNYDSEKDKQLLANEKTLRMLLPPTKLKNRTAAFLQKIRSEHKQVTQKKFELTQLQYQFLQFCWNLRCYGSAFFNAMVYMTKPIKGAMHVHVGVNDYGLHLVDANTKTLFQSYPLKSLTWTYLDRRPYLEMKIQQMLGYHVFTLNTRQANHINMLLTKLLEINNNRDTAAASRK